jgi:hypothetical protein
MAATVLLVLNCAKNQRKSFQLVVGCCSPRPVPASQKSCAKVFNSLTD